ncbi:MAG: hypothetical protein J1E85_07160 [Ruminococcus sp.]|nr:hypothetical protein [Ruminococcus sp.]
MLNSKSRFSQMMITLFVAILGIVLIQNYAFVNQSFLTSVFSIIIGLVVLLVCTVPSLIVKSKTDLSFASFVRRETPTAMVFLSMFYALYFVYAIVLFLSKYASVFTSTGNRSDAGFSVVFIMLAVCVFASCRGIGAVARCSLIFFAFAVVALTLIFVGNISNLDFSAFEFELNGGQLQYGSAVFAMIAFAAVVFGFFEYNSRTRVKNTVFLVCGIGILLFLVVFFVFFALGNYGTMQKYQMFVLSKTADIGGVGCIDSFHLSLCAVTIFVLVSLCLICVGKVVDRDKSVWCMTIFAAISYVLYLTADYYNSVKEIIFNPYVFDVFTILASFVVPVIYITIFWRRLNA